MTTNRILPVVGLLGALVFTLTVLAAPLPVPTAVGVTVPSSTWTVTRQSLQWIQTGSTDGGVAIYDVAIYGCYVDGAGSARGCETITMKGDGSAVLNGKGVVILTPAPPLLVSAVTTLGTHLDTMLTNLASAGKLSPR